jgi:predicted enzyme related to lactoylglutathione lyase
MTVDTGYPDPDAQGVAATPYVKDIVIDCLDAEVVATFWSRLLDRPVAGRTGPYLWLDRAGGIGLVFQQVSTATPGKNRLHLDLGSADLDSDQRRVERLGGHRVSGYDVGGFLVMADPEGNEFCVIPAGPFEVDADGRTNYLERR